VPHDPGREHAAAAAARDEQPAWVDVSLAEHRVDARHEVVEVLVGIVVVDEIGECLSIARTAARIHVQDHITGGGVQLLLGAAKLAP